VEQGRALFKKGNAKKALPLIERAVTIKADSDEALLLLANCYLERGQMRKALDAANLSLTVNKENADAYLVVGTVQQSMEHVSEARGAYQSYLKLAPKGEFASDVRSILSSLK
jgi:tetratricopeptide (TPR) repeat protein